MSEQGEWPMVIRSHIVQAFQQNEFRLAEVPKLNHASNKTIYNYFQNLLNSNLVICYKLLLFMMFSQPPHIVMLISDKWI